jgi:ABC-type Fe3+-hydroxamate transport system substrate-binding protein
MKIVSLVPSVTETLSAWGRTPIACTRFCERDDLEHVGGTKDPDIARIVALKPDLVVMDAEENRREDHDFLLGHGLNIVALRVRSLEDVNPSMWDLARRVDATWEPCEFGDVSSVILSAFVPIWRRPWMALGVPTYGSSLLRHLGVRNVFGGGPYPKIELNDAALRKPDVVLAPSEPYPFTKRQLPELETVAPTTFVDGKDLFWWGVRTWGAVERLRHLVAGLSQRNRG